MQNSTLAQPNVPRAPKLLNRVREAMRTSRYSPRTEAVYVDWIKRYIRFHGIRHPQEMGRRATNNARLSPPSSASNSLS
jgi:hypothetical protein